MKNVKPKRFEVLGLRNQKDYDWLMRDDKKVKVKSHTKKSSVYFIEEPYGLPFDLQPTGKFKVRKRKTIIYNTAYFNKMKKSGR